MTFNRRSFIMFACLYWCSLQNQESGSPVDIHVLLDYFNSVEKSHFVIS